jgi:hypothetical protein
MCYENDHILKKKIIEKELFYTFLRYYMTKTYHRKGYAMKTIKIQILMFKTNRNASEFVSPCEYSLVAETIFIDRFVEKTFSSASWQFPIPPVFGDVWNDFVIGTNFSGLYQIAYETMQCGTVQRPTGF